MAKIATPYKTRELIGLLKRRYWGPTDKRNGADMFAQQHTVLHSCLQDGYKIAFIGDILSPGGKHLRIGTELKAYLSACDYLIGNFESTITDDDTPSSIGACRHLPQIMDALEELFPPQRTYLGVANNHAGDFGEGIWRESCDQLRHRGFHIFGSCYNPFVDIQDSLRIVGTTQWSNQPCDYVAKLEQSLDYLSPDRCNILYPHWGYELELSPRREIEQLGKSLLSEYDAIVGHHSHTPQPVTIVRAPGDPSNNKLLAYSLGNFSAGGNKQFNYHGQILTATIGQQSDDAWEIGEIEWHNLRLKLIGSSTIETELDATALPNARQLRPNQLRITLTKLGLLPPTHGDPS